MRRGAVPAPRRILSPARLRRSRAATQRRAAGQRPAPRRSPPHRRSRARCPRPPARAQDGSRDTEAAAQPLRQLPSRPAPCTAANSACQPPASLPPRHRRASRAPRRARRSLCAARSPAVPSRGARWRQPPPRAEAASTGTIPARQSAHTRKTPRGKTACVTPYRSSVRAAVRRLHTARRPSPWRMPTAGTARRPNASPARRSARPHRAIPLSQTWLPLSPYPTTKRTLPTLWESPFVSMPVNSVPRLNVVRQVLERIDELTILRDLKMQMRTAADAARAGHADGLSCLTTAPTLTERLERCW